MAGQYGPVLLSRVVASGGLLVDQSMAAMLPAGSVSALVYANRFVSVVLTLLGRRCLHGHRALLLAHDRTSRLGRMPPHAPHLGPPHRARLRAHRGVAHRRRAPAGSHRLQHGHFGPRDTAVVAPVLAMYAIQIPFFVISRVYYRFLVAMRRTDLILYCGILNLGLDIVLNLVLMRWFGVAGIALATSLWTVSTFLLSLVLEPESCSRARVRRGGGRMIPAPAQYLLRFDDLCPTVCDERWQRFESLIEEFQPAAHSRRRSRQPRPRARRLRHRTAGFWERMRSSRSGGSDDRPARLPPSLRSRGRSLLGLLARRSLQACQPRRNASGSATGLHILRGHGLNPSIFVAPRHGFDETHARRSSRRGNHLLSDGFARVPFLRGGLTWIPQQLWGPVRQAERRLDNLHASQYRVR